MNFNNGVDFTLNFLRARALRAVAGAPLVAASLLWEACEASGELRTALAADEASAGMIAHDLAQASGHAGVCIVTIGAGVANLVGVIGNAWLEAVPLVCIAIEPSHKESSPACGRAIRSDHVVEPITKANFRIEDFDELVDWLPEAFRIAESEQPGPVLIEIADTALGAATARSSRAATAQAQRALSSDRAGFCA